jgi:hypothetical protein
MCKHNKGLAEEIKYILHMQLVHTWALTVLSKGKLINEPKN